MKVYLLFYDTDYGASEEWNIFYTPCEVFTTAAARQARIDYIRTQCPDRFEFYKQDVEEIALDQVTTAAIRNNDDEDDEDEDEDEE